LATIAPDRVVTVDIKPAADAMMAELARDAGDLIEPAQLGRPVKFIADRLESFVSDIHGTAPGPHGYYGMGGAPISPQDACVIKLEPNGGVICAVGVTERGQGVDTVMGQIAAAALGVPMESIRVLSGDTDATPFGGSTYVSRATAIVVGGSVASD